MKDPKMKPCWHCGKMGHYAYQCIKNPKKRQTLKKIGKFGKQWKITRTTWFKRNPPIEDPFPHYICYICEKWLLPSETTLDHVLSRSRPPS